MSAKQVFRQVTEHETEICIRDYGADGAHVEVTLFDLSGAEQYSSTLYISLTPKEARLLGDALLSQSQRVEDRRPHGNC